MTVSVVLLLTTAVLLVGVTVIHHRPLAAAEQTAPGEPPGAAGSTNDAARPAVDLPGALRRPVALAASGKWLYAACRGNGCISVIDTDTQQVTAEVAAGSRLADLAALDDGRHLLAVDEAEHEVIVLHRTDDLARAAGNAPLQVVQRIRVAHTPVRLVVHPDGRRAAVSSLWSRRVTLLDLWSASDAGSSPVLSIAGVIDLPFAPRMLVYSHRPPVEAVRPGDRSSRWPYRRRNTRRRTSPGYSAAPGYADPAPADTQKASADPADSGTSEEVISPKAYARGARPRRSAVAVSAHRRPGPADWLIVADAFGGRLAVIDPASQSIAHAIEIHASNIRGMSLAADGRRLLLSHQMLNSQQSTTHDGVFWGNVLSNVVREMPLDRVFQHPNAPSDVNDTIPLGHPSSGTGDPGELLVAGEGQVIVTLSGVGEVTVQPTPSEPYARRQTGRHPTALAASTDGRFVYVANTHDDSLTILEAPRMKPAGTISLGPQTELTAADRGELLFYDARLSLDGWFSCHSCHTDGHTISQLNDNFSDSAFGASKQVLSLLGVNETRPWAWNGGVDRLSEQLAKSVQVTMQGFEPDADDVNDLAAYLAQLTPPPGVTAARGTSDQALVARGRQLFGSLGCVNCHTPPLYTTQGVFDVGLKDEAGNREFNPPSLRGVSQRDALFHDGRARSLDEVLTVVRHQLSRELSPAEVEQLLAFLRSL